MLTITTAESDFLLSARLPAEPRVAVLIPCFSEELTVSEVVRQFRARLPQANVYVFDNNSSDRTAERAGEAGATVVGERRQGKGYVVQSMFRQVEADVYLLVDGDGTYPSEIVCELIKPIMAGEADMVVGTRWQNQTQTTCKYLNRIGNRFFRSLLNTFFDIQLSDVLSGYRALSREFVKGVPLISSGFEIEVELTIKATQHGYRILEVPARVSRRPPGSHSKVHIIRDGFVVLKTILTLFRKHRPLTFFGLLGIVLIGGGCFPALMMIAESIDRGIKLRLPLALLSAILILPGIIALFVGLVRH